MSDRGDFLGSFIGLAVACVINYSLGYYFGRSDGVSSISQEKVYYQDIDGDSRGDVLIVNNQGNRHIFLQQEDGSYKRLEDVKSDESIQIEARAKSFLESQVK